MAADFGAILGGILQGLGQGAVGFQYGRQNALEQQKLAIEKQRADQQAQQDILRNQLLQREVDIRAAAQKSAEEAAFTSVPASELPKAMQGMPADENGMVRVPTRSLAQIETARKREYDEGRITNVQNVLNRRDLGGE